MLQPQHPCMHAPEYCCEEGPDVSCAACCAVHHNRRDYDEAKGSWVWAREAPPSQKAPGGGDTVKKLRKKVRVSCKP
jgi:hypothetical protein